MAYRKVWEHTVPLLPGQDDQQLVWLMRESAETAAQSYLLKVVEFEDLGTVPREDIRPVGLKQLGPDYRDAVFRRFRIVAERDPDAAGI